MRIELIRLAPDGLASHCDTITPLIHKSSRWKSNPHLCLRRATIYPLNYRNEVFSERVELSISNLGGFYVIHYTTRTKAGQ